MELFINRQAIAIRLVLCLVYLYLYNAHVYGVFNKSMDNETVQYSTLTTRERRSI